MVTFISSTIDDDDDDDVPRIARETLPITRNHWVAKDVRRMSGAGIIGVLMLCYCSRNETPFRDTRTIAMYARDQAGIVYNACESVTTRVRVTCTLSLSLSLSLDDIMHSDDVELYTYQAFFSYRHSLKQR